MFPKESLNKICLGSYANNSATRRRQFLRQGTSFRASVVSPHSACASSNRPIILRVTYHNQILGTKKIYLDFILQSLGEATTWVEERHQQQEAPEASAGVQGSRAEAHGDE